MSTAIVIVNYRTPGLVIGCLNSLREEVAALSGTRVFVGDAASGDESVAAISGYIEAEGLTWATCYGIGKNGGFAYGNNHILQTHVLPDPSFTHVHFLNPDAYIHPGAVTALRAHLDAIPGAGVAGSRLENPDGTPRSYGFRDPKPWREFFRGARLGLLDRLVPRAAVKIEDLEITQEVDWVTGASFMMPRAVLEAVGLMDDGYFLYFEETDLMARVRKAGHSVWHVAESRVVHLAGQSTGVRTGAPGEATEIRRLSPIWLRSRQRFFVKHYGKLCAGLGTLAFLTGDVFYRLHRVVLRRPVQDPPHLWRDYLKYGLRSSPPKDTE
ncbi:MAG: glycosyltransferase family 2 protein [Parvularcula sp.]|nr:glycosyltransferase family 2 protein [Parvularcula sp.]